MNQSKIIIEIGHNKDFNLEKLRNIIKKKLDNYYRKGIREYAIYTTQ